MPRKDRRFTPEDLKRLYCKNLSANDRTLYDGMDCSWEDLTPLEKALSVLDLLNSPPISYVWDYLPLGGIATQAIDILTELLLLEKEGLTGEIPELPI